MIHHNQIVIEGVIVEPPKKNRLIIEHYPPENDRTVLIFIDTSKIYISSLHLGKTIMVVGRIDYEDENPDSLIIRASTVITSPTPKNNLEVFERLLEDA